MILLLVHNIIKKIEFKVEVSNFFQKYLQIIKKILFKTVNMEGFMINVNKNAPAIARSEIEIIAEPETVWDMLIDIENWPKWNHDMKNASSKGEVSVGSSFKWKAGPGTITSTFQEIERPKLLVWTGKTLGIKAIHVWKLMPKDDKTIVRSEESWEGLIISIIPGRMEKTLEESTESGLQYLKAGIEHTPKP